MKEEATPKVSVLVPTYNRSVFLQKAISSILSQSYTNLEIIVIDNCSSDDTEQCVKRFADERVQYFRNDINIGPINNHNKALRLAKGEYIYIFSDDDIMLEDNILHKVNILEEFDSVGLVHSDIETINEKDDIIKGHWAASQGEWDIVVKNNLMRGDDCYNILYNGWNFISMPSVLIRKKVLDENRIEFNNQLRYLIDWDLWIRISLFCDIYFINKKLVLYREHSTSETLSLNRSVYFIELVSMKLGLLSLYGDKSEKISEDVDIICTSTKYQTGILKIGDLNNQSVTYKLKQFMKKILTIY